MPRGSKESKDHSTTPIKHELDIELMEKLYQFGAITVYQVSYLDPITFRVIDLPLTFSEKHATEQLEHKKQAGFQVNLRELPIRFDEAFSICN